ncbi:MAG: hypothetical protein DRN14_03620 [Thermoplasmata archaeon]|nr:MAG: hypothetical protein DRN14_03620 [Thermoplasmata archaeon]
MSIQYDIADVLEEVGLSFTIEHMGVPVPDVVEYLTYTPNTQVTKPFVREHFLEVAFRSDTSVLSGDIITFVVSGDSYLVMNNTPDFFENEIIRYLAVLYKTNVLIDILRPQHTTVGYNTQFDFVVVVSAQKALIYAPLFGNIGRVDPDAGSYALDKEELYTPIAYDLREVDRVRITGTSEFYQVNTVILRRFPAVAVSGLREDTRGM